MMIKLSWEQLITQATTVVLGNVVSQTSAWNAEHSAIYTDVTVAVEQVITGPSQTEVTFRIPGGTVGDRAMRSSVDPVFHHGERVIVFLNTEGVHAGVVGLQQGKYTVRDGTVTRDGQTLAVADFVAAIRAAVQEG